MGVPDIRVLALMEDRTFRLSRRALARLEAFARGAELTEEVALQVAITHALGTLQRGQPVWMDVRDEPPLPPLPDHKRGSDRG